MKKVLSLLVVASILVASCKSKGCDPVSPTTEEPTIIAYTATAGGTWVKHNSGIYYQIIANGSGSAPNDNSIVWVNYTGKYLNGTVFDSNTNPTSPYKSQLGALIDGWRITLPFIKIGGKIRMVIPSALAYGCSSSSIPANSVLYFDIDLINVQ
jgi:FKBP-type peptidyl-prolyl cis-trans isomerase FkpA